jgi:hypothetical protein
MPRQSALTPNIESLALPLSIRDATAETHPQGNPAGWYGAQLKRPITPPTTIIVPKPRTIHT